MRTIATATNSNIYFISEDNYVTTMKNKSQGTKRGICKQPFCLSSLLWEMIKLKERDTSLCKKRKQERVNHADELEKVNVSVDRTLEDRNIEK